MGMDGMGWDEMGGGERGEVGGQERKTRVVR